MDESYARRLQAWLASQQIPSDQNTLLRLDEIRKQLEEMRMLSVQKPTPEALKQDPSILPLTIYDLRWLKAIGVDGEA